MPGDYWYIEIWMRTWGYWKTLWLQCIARIKIEHYNELQCANNNITRIHLQEKWCNSEYFLWKLLQCKIVWIFFLRLLKFGVWNKGSWIIELIVLDACDARMLLRVVWRIRILLFLLIFFSLQEYAKIILKQKKGYINIAE